MARKYKQRGYQEGSDDRPRRDSRAPRPRREGPRGRGLGKPSVERFRCAACGAEIRLTEPPGFDAVCSGCGGDLHTCTHCRHFDPGARFECRRHIPERIAGKANRNRCREFEPKRVQEIAGEGGAEGDPRAAFHDLFDF